ncbi:MAG: 30S ribosomal protein S1 [Candidatus Aminicenantes bacterium RBG_13_62_12]|jgi:small subunit ribosomal protein S1|nr:MAG: 30S ribosomal protein S1 [Candidatus Aminicenantes bacterium RBG_13_62_12]
MAELKKQADREEKISSEDYEQLLDKYQFSAKEITPGKIIKGRVIKATPTGVLMDIGFKSEGVIPIEDFADLDIQKIKPGDEIETILERTDAKEGYLILSKKLADSLRALEHLEKAFATQAFVSGKITEKTKNGYTVNVGIDAFLPDSHADIKIVREPEKLVGQTFKFKVVKFDRKTENAVLSRKLFLQDEREKKKRRVFGRLVKGEKVKGQVRSMTSFGAFIDLGGVEGLLHISDMSWGKTGHPSDVLTAGQEIEVVVLDFNERDERISLGYKQLTEDPWKNIGEKYAAGQKIKGKVVSLTDFGAFVELEKGVEGLVHISDLSWSRKLIHPKKLLSLGEEVVVSVLDVNPETKRISLGLKQATAHPLELLRQKYSPGARVKGKITSITDFGAFMEIEPGVEGLIHISDISWEKVKHAKDKLEVGQETEAVILNIDVERQKVSLGIKQLEGDIWEDFFNRQKVGDMVKVRIVRIAEFGVFVEITPGIEGVVFLSELDEKKIDNAAEAFSIGEERNAKIIKMNPREKKISLSFRLAQLEIQKLEYQKYVSSQDNRLTLGDIMGDRFKKISAPKKEAKEKEGKND